MMEEWNDKNGFHEESRSLLLGFKKNQNEEKDFLSFNKSRSLLVLVCFIIVGGISFQTLKANHQTSSLNKSEKTSFIDKMNEHSYQTLGFEVYNQYGIAKYGADYPFIQNRYVAEPFKMVTLNAVGGVIDEVTTFKWEIYQSLPHGKKNVQMIESLSSDMIHLEGQTAELMLTDTGLYKVSLKAFDSTGNEVATHYSEIFSAYVRRELRRMNDKDRIAFLETASTIWKVGTEEGRVVYGPGYTGMDTMVKIHANQATGDFRCDKWHEGTGFLTHHLAFSLIFEQSLRAVNKAITTPYWDFTIDGEIIKKANRGPSMLLETNDFFTDKWFGEVDEDSHVINGHWAHAESVVSEDSTIRNSYGIVRAPWNNNLDTELTRHMFDVCGKEPVNKPVPTCQVHAALINSTELPHIMTKIAGWGHGTMHVNTGGVFGECTEAMDDLYTKYEDELSVNVSMTSLSEMVAEKFHGVHPKWKSTAMFPLEDFVVDTFHLEYFHIYRTLWRSQTCALDGMPFALECPKNCDMSVPFHDCKCKCKGVDRDDFDWKNIEPCLYMQNKTKWITQSALSEDFRKDLVKTVCSAGVLEGEQLESASPLDIVFWMIHPVLDRLLVAKRLISHNENSPDISFGAYGKILPLEDESWLTFSSYSTPHYTCDGHSPDDKVLENMDMFKKLSDAADINKDGIITNLEFYEAVNPNRFNVDYIYDDFKWDHCDMEKDLTTIDIATLQSNSFESSFLKPQRSPRAKRQH